MARSSPGVRHRVETALQALDQAVVLFDAADRVVYCNAAYLDLLGITGTLEPLLGLSRAQVIDVWLDSLEFESQAARQRFRADRSRQRGARAIDYEVRTAGGRWLRVNERPTPDGGIITLISDATGDMLCAESLADVQATAEAASMDKRDFIEQVSYELKTSLNTILGFAELIERDTKEPLPKRHRHRVAQIMTSGEHLLQLAHDVRELSRLESGGVILSLEPLNVLDLIESACASLRAKAARSGMSIEIAPATVGDSLTILADRPCCAQILMNFGSQAIQYGPKGGRVTFAASAISPESVRVMVSAVDSSIPANSLHEASRGFQDAQREAEQSESGPGMGLVIAQRVAELMHGRVAFHHFWNRGLQLWMDLPASDQAAALREPASHSASKERAQPSAISGPFRTAHAPAALAPRDLNARRAR